MEKIIIICSTGRMGQAILKEINEMNLNIQVLKYDQGDEFPSENIDLMIDFSTIEGVLKHIKLAKEKNSAFLTGVTGFNNEQLKEIESYKNDIPVLIDFNMSIGINTITSLLNQLKDKLVGYDIEIIETHHKHKKDAPSGTAKKIFNELNKKSRFKEVDGRTGESLRTEDEIGIHAVRGGGVFGEHTVRFINESEEVAISHRAFSRTTFAKGAVRAGLWLMKQKKGFYNMLDYLNI